ncbi:unnamed protein product, partial [Prorocentrum cordatum]
MEAAGLESTINGLKDDIQKSKDKAADLEKRLGELRTSEAKNAQLFEVGVREVDEVISKASNLARRKAAKLLAPKRSVSSDSGQVSSLQQLGRQLSFARAGDDAGSGGGLGMAPASFLQTSPAAADGTSRGPEAVLMADKFDVLKAQNSTQTAFEAEERQLQDLVDIEKKRLQVLEASLKDQQPILTEKLKQATETSSLFEMAKRNLLRDRTLLNMTIALSKKILDGHDLMDPKRHEIVNLVKMPIKMLESMDMASFLSRDLQHLSAAPALVQVAARSRARSRARSSTKEDSPTAQMALATSEVEEEDSAVAEPADPQ